MPRVASRRAAPLLFLTLVLLLSAGSQAQRQAVQQQPQQQQPQQQSQQQQPPEEQPQQPTFRAEINFVRVDVIVTDRDGNPVTDLEADDFEVFEDDTPQTIDSFRLVRLTGTPEPGAEPARPIRSGFDEEREAARGDVRLFAIFFDDYHVRLENAVRLREALINFIYTQLGPSDLVSVMYPLTPLDSVQMTRNHESIVAAIERFEGRKYEYEPRNLFEQQYAYYPTSVVERIRNEVSLSGLRALVTHLGGLREGRKALILVSEGYTNYLPPQLRNRNAASGVRNPNQLNPAAGDHPLERSGAMFADMDITMELQAVLNAANRGNTAIYAVDPRGLASEFDLSQPTISTRTDARALRTTMGTLRTLAEESDGRAIVNQNDVGPGLRQMVRDSSTYYLIGYNSTQAPSDGKFHEIKVRVKRDGVRVRARKGYWALTADDVVRASAAALDPGPPSEIEEALAAIVEPRRGRFVRTWVGSARGDEGRTRVTVVWEAAPLVPGERREELGRVALTASNDAGDPYYRGRIPDAAGGTNARDSGASRQSGLSPPSSGRVAFDAAPGQMHMIIAVEGTTGDVLDREITKTTIVDFTGTDVAFSTPALFRAGTELEMRRLVGDLEAVPTAGRTFRRTDRVLIRFEVYAPGSAVPTVTARLLGRSGSPMSDIPVPPPAPGQPTQIDLALARLAPGEYLVELSATAGDEDAKELIAFRVVS